LIKKKDIYNATKYSKAPNQHIRMISDAGNSAFPSQE